MSKLWRIAAMLAVTACVSAPDAPPPGHSSVWGYVTPVPHEGVSSGGGGAYGDRRLRHARLVDYSRPGYAVVYVDAPGGAMEPAMVEIRDTGMGVRFEPPYATTRVGGATRIRNASVSAHVLSVPAANLVRRLAPGESVEVRHEVAGPYQSFLLDVPGTSSSVFAAPGPFVVVSDSGRYELGPLSPGAHVLRTWHPRFPPTAERVVLSTGRAERVDLEIGVGHGEGEGVDDAR